MQLSYRVVFNKLRQFRIWLSAFVWKRIHNKETNCLQSNPCPFSSLCSHAFPMGRATTANERSCFSHASHPVPKSLSSPLASPTHSQVPENSSPVSSSKLKTLSPAFTEVSRGTFANQNFPEFSPTKLQNLCRVLRASRLARKDYSTHINYSIVVGCRCRA